MTCFLCHSCRSPSRTLPWEFWLWTDQYHLMFHLANRQSLGIPRRPLLEERLSVCAYLSYKSQHKQPGTESSSRYCSGGSCLEQNSSTKFWSSQESCISWFKVMEPFIEGPVGWPLLISEVNPCCAIIYGFFFVNTSCHIRKRKGGSWV